MIQVTKEEAELIRENCNAHVRRTAHKWYAEENRDVKRILEKFNKKRKIKNSGGEK